MANFNYKALACECDLFQEIGGRANLLERDVYTLGGFCKRLLDHLWCQEIERAIHVFLAVMIPQAPGAALWKTFDWLLSTLKTTTSSASDTYHQGGHPSPLESTPSISTVET